MGERIGGRYGREDRLQVWERGEVTGMGERIGGRYGREDRWQVWERG
jgi:hypothetical protein